jgi:hypothetical protein
MATNVRGNYERTLMSQWLKLHRPDVVELIKKLVANKYPAKPMGRTATVEFPEQLKDFK